MCIGSVLLLLAQARLPVCPHAWHGPSKTDPNGIILIGSANDEIKSIFWASSDMIASIQENPEVISVDNTYNVDKSGMPLSIFMTKDRNGFGRMVHYSLLRDEKQDTMRSFLSSFRECH